MSSSGRKAPRGGGGGRGGGGRGRGGRGNRSSSSANVNKNTNSTSSSPSPRTNIHHSSGNRRRTTATSSTSTSNNNFTGVNLKDEEVLIAFMPFLKGGNHEAMTIHERYQSNNDYSTFLLEARGFLGQQQFSSTSSSASTAAATQPSTDGDPSRHQHHNPPSRVLDSSYADAATLSSTTAAISETSKASAPTIAHSVNVSVDTRNDNGFESLLQRSSQQQLHHHHHYQEPLQRPPSNAFLNSGDQTLSMESMEQKMANLLSDNDDVVAMPGSMQETFSSYGMSDADSISGKVIGGTAMPSSSDPINPSAQSLLLPPSSSAAGQQHSQSLPIGTFGHQQSEMLQQSSQTYYRSHVATSLPSNVSHELQQQQNFLSQQFMQGAIPPRNGNLMTSPQSQVPVPGMVPSPQFSMFSSNGNDVRSEHSPLFSSQPRVVHDVGIPHDDAWSTSSKSAYPPGLSSPSTLMYLHGRPRTASESSRSPMIAPIASPAIPSPQVMSAHQQSGPRVSPTPFSLSMSSPSVAAHLQPVIAQSLTPGTSKNNGTPGTALPARTPKKEFLPKRLWTHVEEQPGKIVVNNVAAVDGRVLHLHPRQELTARWMLPISYLQQMAREDDRPADTLADIRDLLQDLSLGLFRRGCIENGSQASIVSKEIVQVGSGHREDYPFQITQNMVVGSIPFYSPRTPGHVIFRLYRSDRPVHTLATGPTLNVRVTEEDFESAIRFILSNFKAKKVNPTSLSSLNSLSLVLEQFEVTTVNLSPNVQRQLEGAGRAVWGCVCEARKVLDACAVDYHKTTSKLEKLEEVVDDLKEKIAGEEQEKLLAAAAAGADLEDDDIKDDEWNDQGGDGSEHISESVSLLREKTKMLMTGRASCERKWRDSQLAFAAILRAIIFNRGMSLLLRRELITKLRLEYELWCPLCEEFAVPGDQGDAIVMWYQPLNNLSQPISAEHFRMCQEARGKMQHRILGFVPNTTSVRNLLYQNHNEMSHSAVNSFNGLSSSMAKLYQDVYFTADRIFQQRENIRAEVERLVGMCNEFPVGTKVAVFGSSANGFGSPKSDLDMCLQIPEGAMVLSDDDPTGSNAMASLAKILEENGMMDVDTSRLTARIPVIKFNSRRGNTIEVSSDEESLMECDLSMHNPLAVLNTALLRTYAEINPVPRVLAAVIKRWAKARDINNPARHTLSSYGYILMLLHFLTYHQRSKDGFVEPLDEAAGRNSSPLLPNLQWMDDKWPTMPPGTPYCELSNRPNIRVQHPLEESVRINSYFYRTNPAMMSNLQRLFPGQDLSLGILLASFFRYYAYDFDYKRHVVSLHSRYSTGLVEREVKAELDGWRNYSAALTIEDPFETFYDVAHVLRGGYYHRIRREFAVAYTKIADVALGKTSTTWNNKVVDLTSMNGMALIDWICEPLISETSSSMTGTPGPAAT